MSYNGPAIRQGQKPGGGGGFGQSQVWHSGVSSAQRDVSEHQPRRERDAQFTRDDSKRSTGGL